MRPDLNRRGSRRGALVAWLRALPAGACALLLAAIGVPAEGAPRWVLAVHGGAGSLPKDLPAADVTAIRESMEHALEEGSRILDAGGAGLDAVQAAVRLMEDSGVLTPGAARCCAPSSRSAAGLRDPRCRGIRQGRSAPSRWTPAAIWPPRPPPEA